MIRFFIIGALLVVSPVAAAAEELRSPPLDLYSIQETADGQYRGLHHFREILTLRWPDRVLAEDMYADLTDYVVFSSITESALFVRTDRRAWSPRQIALVHSFFSNSANSPWLFPFPDRPYDFERPSSPENPSAVPTDRGFTRAKLVGVRYVYPHSPTAKPREIELVFEFFDPNNPKTPGRWVLPLHEGHLDIRPFDGFNPQDAKSVIAGFAYAPDQVDAIRIIEVDPYHPKILWVAFAREMANALNAVSAKQNDFRVFPVQEELVRLPDPNRPDQYLEWVSHESTHDDNVRYAFTAWSNSGKPTLSYPKELKDDFAALNHFWRDGLRQHINRPGFLSLPGYLVGILACLLPIAQAGL